MQIHKFDYATHPCARFVRRWCAAGGAGLAGPEVQQSSCCSLSASSAPASIDTSTRWQRASRRLTLSSSSRNWSCRHIIGHCCGITMLSYARSALNRYIYALALASAGERVGSMGAVQLERVGQHCIANDSQVWDAMDECSATHRQSAPVWRLLTHPLHCLVFSLPKIPADASALPARQSSHPSCCPVRCRWLCHQQLMQPCSSLEALPVGALLHPVPDCLRLTILTVTSVGSVARLCSC